MAKQLVFDRKGNAVVQDVTAKPATPSKRYQVDALIMRGESAADWMQTIELLARELVEAPDRLSVDDLRVLL